jgi:hypothetical protein
LSQTIGQRHEAVHNLPSLGHAQRELDQLSQARDTLREVLGTAADIDEFTSQVESLSLVAVHLADRGEKERAMEIYALARRYPYAANSRYWEDIAGKHIAAIAAELPSEVVAAAQERGRARDLKATVQELLMELEAAPDRRSLLPHGP